MIQKRAIGNPAGAILTLLQRKGPLTIKELEVALGVTATAVRQQVNSLLAEDYVKQTTVSVGRGRPKHVYTLAPKGLALFPHHYDEFTNSLLQEILVSEGPQKVSRLLGRMSQKMAAQYDEQMAGQSPAARALELTELLNAKGILTEIQVMPNSILFQEYNCPYYELARRHREVCEMELGMISQVIKQPVELVSCTLDGHHGCQFKIDM